MAGFKGQAENTIDGKGRLPVPAKLRRSLSADARETFVVTRGLGPYVVLYPLDYWDRVLEVRMAALDDFNPRHGAFVRQFTGHADEVTMDGQGRVAISKPLMDLAGLEPGEKALVVGTATCIEVWNPQTYLDHLQAADDFGALAEDVMGTSNPPATLPEHP